VPFQLDVLHREHPRERVVLLSLLPVPVAQVPGESTAADLMGRIVDGVERGALQDAELGLDEIEPRGVRRGEDRGDAQLAQQAEEPGVIVHVGQVVEHDVEAAPGVAGAQPTKGRAQIHDALKKGGYVIYAGQSELKGKILRVAHMGQLLQQDLKAFLKALKDVLETGRVMS